ncbi:hypothetical protein MP228_008069 [Amoeboaphelidium protococcarum]|nr:hypothetical protein MP228_008069 [Amoeboaphelidium protococcarum]
MPKPGMPGALEVFTGSRVGSFLSRWEALAKNFNLDDQDRVLKLVMYCDSMVQTDLASFTHYPNGTYEDFKKEMLSFYENMDFPNLQDLLDLKQSKESSKSKIKKYINYSQRLVEKDTINQKLQKILFIEMLSSQIQWLLPIQYGKLESVDFTEMSQFAIQVADYGDALTAQEQAVERLQAQIDQLTLKQRY